MALEIVRLETNFLRRLIHGAPRHTDRGVNVGHGERVLRGYLFKRTAWCTAIGFPLVKTAGDWWLMPHTLAKIPDAPEQVTFPLCIIVSANHLPLCKWRTPASRPLHSQCSHDPRRQRGKDSRGKGPPEAETEVVDPVAGCAPIAVGGAEMPRNVDPGAAAKHTGTAI